MKVIIIFGSVKSSSANTIKIIISFAVVFLKEHYLASRRRLYSTLFYSIVMQNRIGKRLH